MASDSFLRQFRENQETVSLGLPEYRETSREDDNEDSIDNGFDSWYFGASSMG